MSEDKYCRMPLEELEELFAAKQEVGDVGELRALIAEIYRRRQSSNGNAPDPAPPATIEPEDEPEPEDAEDPRDRRIPPRGLLRAHRLGVRVLLAREAMLTAGVLGATSGTGSRRSVGRPARRRACTGSNRPSGASIRARRSSAGC